MDERIPQSNIIPGEALEEAAKSLVARAMEECHNAYNMGFCRGIASVLVIGGAGGDLTKEGSKNIMAALAVHLSPAMQSEIARVINELTAMVKHQVDTSNQKPN